MDNELEVIRDEMELTRANLAEKLGALETQVRETVSTATDAVSSTVDGVKGVVSSVSETVETVTETFNVSKHVERHPWLAMGAAVATGFVIAQLIDRMGSHPVPAHGPPPTPTPPPTHDLHLQPLGGSSVPAATGAPRPAEQRTEPPAEPPAESQKESGLMHSIESMLPDMKPVMNTVVSSLGGMAVGGLMGLIREMASTGLPKEWQGEATKLIDQVTTQLGGKPLDTAKSGQLFSALGLGDFLSGLTGHGNGHGQGQGGQTQGGQQQDAARSQQGGQGGSPSSFSSGRVTTGTGRPSGQRL